jgi:hypothetical protein
MFDPELHPDHPIDADRVLDAALDSYPLTPVPSGLVRRTLARIQPRPMPRFRLEFLDIAVPLFIVLFGLLTIWAAFWTLNYVSPYWTLEWTPRLAYFRQWLAFELMRLPDWLPVVSVMMGSLFITGICLSLILLVERSLLSMRLRN